MSGQHAAIPAGPIATPAVLSADDDGCLTDADPGRELAQLTALRNHQRLVGDSPMAPATTPQTLLSLFSHA